jgi:hypothetical protein
MATRFIHTRPSIHVGSRHSLPKFYPYKEIVDYGITGVVMDDSEDQPVFGLILEKDRDQKIAWIMRDAEGNGAGHLDIDHNTNWIMREK